MGTLLLAVGEILRAFTLLAVIVYLFGTVLWMHAPLLGVLMVTAPMALVPLGLAWLCRRLGRRLRGSRPGRPPD